MILHLANACYKQLGLAILNKRLKKWKSLSCEFINKKVVLRMHCEHDQNVKEKYTKYYVRKEFTNIKKKLKVVYNMNWKIVSRWVGKRWSCKPQV